MEEHLSQYETRKVADSMSQKGASRGEPPHARPRRRRWASFVADEVPRGRVVRGLHEEDNPTHRLRVEYDAHTLLIHLSDEDGSGWTTVAIDRASRRWAVSQGPRQMDTARDAYNSLYGLNGTGHGATRRQSERDVSPTREGRSWNL